MSYNFKHFILYFYFALILLFFMHLFQYLAEWKIV